jgi:DNA-binding CsgD family transcriptional regulator
MGADMYPRLELSAFLHRAAGCKTYPQLRSAIYDCGNVLPAPVWGWTRFGKNLSVTDIGGRNATDKFFARYERLGPTLDPVLPVVLAGHIPVHNMQVIRDWDCHPCYREIFQPVGWKHFLSAPVVRDGALVATLNYARETRDKPFDANDLWTAFSVANHVSALLARTDEDACPGGLAQRELEIARLVAAGLNNAEIATCLGISRNTVKGALKRVFRKLDVDSRAEMAARLAAAGML